MIENIIEKIKSKELMTTEDIANYLANNGINYKKASISSLFAKWHDKIKSSHSIGKNKKLYKKQDVEKFFNWYFSR